MLSCTDAGTIEAHAVILSGVLLNLAMVWKALRRARRRGDD